MEYTITINQKRALEWNLTKNEAFLCYFYCLPNTWVRTRIVDADGDYICIVISKLIEELPFIGNTKMPFSKALNSLVQKGVFEKIVDEDNSRNNFYRMHPAYKVAWKYGTVELASHISSRILLITNVINNIEVLLNDNTITKNIQLISNDNKVLLNDNKVLSNENEVLSNDNLSNNIISNNTNQLNNHNNDKKINLKSKMLEDEFNKLVSFYPTTINNKPKNLSLAFGAYQALSSDKRLLVLKAVKHFAKTQYVHSKQNETNFIPSLHSFLTNKDFKEVLKQPIHKDFSENLEKNSEEVGAGIAYDEVETKQYIFYVNLFRKLQDKPERAKELLGDDFEIFSEEVGAVQLPKFGAEELAETMMNIKKEREV